MPVKIQNKISGKIEIVNIRDSKIDELSSWGIIARKDIVQVYEPSIFSRTTGFINHGEYEKSDLEQILRDNPNYKYNDVSDFGDWDLEGNLFLKFLPVNNPTTYAKIIKKAIIKPSVSILDNSYIKSIIIGVVILITWFFMYPFLKDYFNHS